MELLLLCALVVFAGVTPTQGGILNVNKMIKQVTGKTPILYYGSYGCHCGPGGKGPPVDASDWCCHAHECCYAKLKLQRCRIHRDHYTYNFTQGNIQCSDTGSWCEQELCACDKEVAFCLQRNLGTYKKKQRYIRLFSRSRCKGQTPMC
ncbi:PREDICTED: group IID secretory phospholipase A2 isoform X2 [Hipposideros armiger]|uniref:Phospholipase A2 n=1 Tax=Hipposideros armiger TaxID=186990 RepID=A0A8B7TED7_HIPAR|nr:PREDICTED: group IID secretory phospholipase A2 isoform X2 [Hipposideros armiger]